MREEGGRRERGERGRGEGGGREGGENINWPMVRVCIIHTLCHIQCWPGMQE